MIIHAGSAFSQEKIELKFAKELSGKIIDGQEVREANGNVEFIQGNVKVYCNSASQYLSSNRVELRGNVRIYQDTLSLFTSNANYFGDDKKAICEGGVTLKDTKATLRADNGIYSFNDSKAIFSGDVIILNPEYKITSGQLTYFRNTEDSFAKINVIVTTDSSVIKADNIDFFKSQGKTFAYGNVSIESDSTIITSDTATNYSNEKKSIAAGRVKIFSMNNNATITGNSLMNFETQNYTVVSGNTALVQTEKEKDTVFIYCDTMKAYRNKPERYEAIGKAELIRGKFSAKCGRGIYYRDNEKVSLILEPIVWQDKIQMTGDSIFAELPDKKLQNIFVKKLPGIPDSRSSFVISENDDNIRIKDESRCDQISGEDITLNFKDDKINLIEVKNESRSIYFMYDNNKPDGVNKTEGRDMSIIFDSEGKVSKIKVKESPKGEYVPESLLNTVTLLLPGFNLRTDKPQKKQ